MKNVCRAYLTVACLALAVSCRSALESEGLAIVTLTLPGFDDATGTVGSRGLLDGWPMGGLPDFSSLTVSVSGPGMSPVTRSLAAYAGSVEIPVTPGSSRLVSIRAVPDWTATAARYPGKPLPTLAKAYAGSATVDVEAGKAASVSISLALAETKILVPNPNGNWQLGVAEDISNVIPDTMSAVAFSSSSNFTYDHYGLLYFSGSENTIYVHAVLGTSLEFFVCNSIPVTSVAVSSRDKLVYGSCYQFSDGDGITIFNLRNNDPTEEVISSPFSTILIGPGGIAVDSTGIVYVPAIQDGIAGIAGLSISDIDGSPNASPLIFASYEQLGIGFWFEGIFKPIALVDIAFVNNLLVVAIPNVVNQANDPDSSRGMVLALEPGTLAVRWKAGWPGDENYFPTDPTSQFYGPARFVGFTQSSVYVVDDGYYYDSQPTDVDRIIEVSTVDGTFRGIGLKDASEFYFRVPF